MRRDVVGVERHELVALPNLIPRLHARLESLPVQLDGLEPDVDEDLDAESGQGQRVSGAVHLKHAPVARGDDAVVEGVDSDPVAGEPLRECGIGNLIERDDDAGEGRENLRGHGGVGSSSTGSVAGAFSSGGAAPSSDARSSRRRLSSRFASFFAFRSSSFFRFSKP